MLTSFYGICIFFTGGGDFDLISEEDFAELETLTPAEEENVDDDSDEEKTIGVDDE